MLHRLRLSNFLSFAGETEISFVMDGRAPETDSDFTSPAGIRLSKVTAMIGANAAGKTNALKALSFLSRFAVESFPAAWEGVSVLSGFFDSDEPASFELDFEVDGRLHRYQLQITPKRVISESLLRKDSKLYRTLFLRQWDKDASVYTVRQNGFDFPAKQTQRIKPLSSLIATGVQFGVEPAKDFFDYFSRIASNIETAAKRKTNDIAAILKASGIYGRDRELAARMTDIVKKLGIGVDYFSFVDGEKFDFGYLPFAAHSGDGKVKHVSLLDESSGTQAVFILLARLLPVLETGGVAVVDAMETGLHPLMLAPILNLFIDPETNLYNAQIVFTTHSLHALAVLQRCQILLVEKDDRGSSAVRRFSEIRGGRNDGAFISKYLAGAYGAVPRI